MQCTFQWGARKWCNSSNEDPPPPPTHPDPPLTDGQTYTGPKMDGLEKRYRQTSRHKRDNQREREKREKEREREKKRERHTHTHTHTHRDRDRERETDRQTDRQTEQREGREGEGGREGEKEEERNIPTHRVHRVGPQKHAVGVVSVEGTVVKSTILLPVAQVELRRKRVCLKASSNVGLCGWLVHTHPLIDQLQRWRIGATDT